MAGQLILGLTILVGLHELGHMLTAKWFGMRVEKFAIGFPPKVVSKQIWRNRIHDRRHSVRWVCENFRYGRRIA